MTSKREDVLAALHDLLSTLTGVSVLRNVELPTKVGAAGLMILRDGQPGEPTDVTLSPLTYHYEHRAELEVFWQAREGQRDDAWDDLSRRVGELVMGNRTLGGRCDWVDADSVEPSDLYSPGGDGIKAATINLVLVYGTANPLI
jgi:hypothetical protein